jgi:hypothetical protein
MEKVFRDVGVHNLRFIPSQMSSKKFVRDDATGLLGTRSRWCGLQVLFLEAHLHHLPHAIRLTEPSVL